jgi:hypothetical protein
MKSVKIYCLRCPKTNEPKYVGRTGNIKQREKSHNNKANKTITKKQLWINELREKGLKPILDVLKIVDPKDGYYWELHYLKLYIHQGYKLLNNNINNLGNQTSFKKGHNSISVVAIDKNYQYVSEFDSCEEADSFISANSTVYSAISGRLKTAGSYVWLKKEDYDKLTPENIKNIVDKAFDNSKKGGKETQFKKGHSAWNKGKKGKLKPDKNVHQYSAITGEFIKTWKTAKIASIELECNAESIGQCARGTNKTAGGYIWSYIKLEKIKPIRYKGKTNNKIKNKLK